MKATDLNKGQILKVKAEFRKFDNITYRFLFKLRKEYCFDVLENGVQTDSVALTKKDLERLETI
jgi:hypothetical protein